ncbi:unnamed protein product [Ranitomeya imitator]|uniref:Gypsy retrotransposon integrase-like protein 1 n=1 Tax=Ranitomeya imitator TaxID=111125 RepID=A0ABN9KXW5_9NEOB|nr:unnamed protein product [Ranitomeya imitator]
MGKTSDLTDVKKAIIDTLKQEGKTQKEISQQIGCSQSAVSRHLNGKSVGRKQCGRKRCTTRRGDRTLRKIVEKDRFQTLGNLRKQWTESGVETSRATMHRRVQEMGYRCRIPQHDLAPAHSAKTTDYETRQFYLQLCQYEDNALMMIHEYFQDDLHHIVENLNTQLLFSELIYRNIHKVKGESLVSHFSVRFRSLASELEWSDKALIPIFWRGLADHIKDALATREIPATLEELITVSTRIDLRFNERRLERAQCRQRFRLAPTFAKPLESPVQASESHEALEVTRAGSKSQSARAHKVRHVCQQSGHIASKGPQRSGKRQCLVAVGGDVFSKRAADTLPPHRPYDCPIDLLPGAEPPRGRVYPLSLPETEAMSQYIQENLARGFIRKSVSPVGAGFFFVQKKTGNLRPCIDYRGLNAITVKNKYPLPLISELFDRLRGARVFTKLDLRGAYNLIRIREGDEWKTAFNTRDGHYEYLVMPFGLCNAPAVFQDFVNDIFRDMLTTSVVVYLDDILIFSPDIDSHRRDVRKVFNLLRANSLYAKLEKCVFEQESLPFLGYIISAQGLAMDPAKLQAVMDWQEPHSLKAVQRFMGFINYYRQFIPHFSTLVAPLVALTKKGANPKLWSEEVSKAFLSIKSHFASAPILHRPDVDKPFILEVDASSVGAGAVLFQKDAQGRKHPCFFFSKTFTPAERNYSIGDRELLAMKLAFSEWRHLLEGARFPFQVFTDHKNLVYLKTAQRLNSRQARWSLFFSQFHFTLHFLSGEKNVRADALSRSVVSSEEEEPRLIVPSESLRTVAPVSLESVPPGKTFVPANLRPEVLSWAHSSRVGGHFGTKRTSELLARIYWWPHMARDVKDYIQACVSCAQNRSPRQRPAGLLYPLPVADRPWEMVGMDFVHPRVPVPMPVSSTDSSVADWAVEARDIWDRTQDAIRASKERMRVSADTHRRPAPIFAPGDLVWLSARNIRLRVESTKFALRYIGPFKVLEQVNPVVYRLAIPPRLGITDTFHVSLLKPVHLSRFSDSSAGTSGSSTDEFEVNAIVGCKVVRGKKFYLVDWKGHGPEDRTWEPVEHIRAPLLIAAFERSEAQGGGTLGGGNIKVKKLIEKPWPARKILQDIYIGGREAMIGLWVSLYVLHRQHNFSSVEAALDELSHRGNDFQSHDIVLQKRNNSLQRVAETHRSYDGLQYPIIFWQGQDGYQFGIPQTDPTTGNPSGKKVSAMDFYAYRIMTRFAEENHILKCKHLFHQFIVDMYAKIESERLLYIRLIQKKLRAEEYIHLRDAVTNDADPKELGKMVILPPTVTGSPRHKHEYTQDAMTYVRKYGRPDLFITFTCNPAWEEIGGHLLPGQKTVNRHDPIARDLKQKFSKMTNLVTKSHIYGQDGYPVYRRRKPGDAGFTAKLKMRVGSSLQEIEIDNRSDQAVFELQKNGPIIDEVEAFQMGRYISSNEAVWRILGFSIHECYPPVVHLSGHLENGQRIYFNPANLQQQLLTPPKTTLLAFFELCQQDPFAKTILYCDSPKYYTWNASRKTLAWRKRGLDTKGYPEVKATDTLGRVYTVHPSNAECFYLRMLLHVVKGPTSFLT